MANLGDSNQSQLNEKENLLAQNPNQTQNMGATNPIDNTSAADINAGSLSSTIPSAETKPSSSAVSDIFEAPEEVINAPAANDEGEESATDDDNNELLAPMQTNHENENNQPSEVQNQQPSQPVNNLGNVQQTDLLTPKAQGKKFLTKPILIGIAAVVLVIGGYLTYQYFSSRQSNNENSDTYDFGPVDQY